MQKINNITIGNNVVEGQESRPVRVRLFHVDIYNGERHPHDVVFDIDPGEEKRVNLTGDTFGFDVRPIIAGQAHAEITEPLPDLFGKIDAYKKLKEAVLSVGLIRADMTLSESERDAKAAAAWAAAVALARQ